MRTSLLIGALAAIIPVGFSLFSTSAEEPAVTALSARAVCDGAVSFEGRIEVVKDEPANPDTHTATIVDDSGNSYATSGFGITGETLIILPDGEPVTKGLELGAPQVDVPADLVVECFISEVSSDFRPLTQEDVDRFSLDQALVGASAEIETSINGVAWMLP